MTFKEFAKHIGVYVGFVGEYIITVFLMSEGSDGYIGCPAHRFDSLDGAVRKYGDRLIDDSGSCCDLYPNNVTFWLQ